jgi:hypothetical protein
MPRVTSLASKSSNKENVAPSFPKVRKGKSSIEIARDEEESDEGEDEVVGLSGQKRSQNASSKQSKHPTKSSKQSKPSDQMLPSFGGSSSDSAPMKRMREAEEDSSVQASEENKSKKERLLEERLALVSVESEIAGSHSILIFLLYTR